MIGALRPKLTRRGFLGASAALLGTRAVPVHAAQAPRFRRQEISDPALAANIISSYKNAIMAMLKLPPTDPRNWYRNAFVHILDCPHGNWWFLPWHKAYLGWFERTCRELSGDQNFALPYWDWTKTPRVPGVMFQDVLDPNNSLFTATFGSFRQNFDVAVTALYASFSQAQRNALAQRGLGSVNDFWNTVTGTFFPQGSARGLTAANPNFDSFTQQTVSSSTINEALSAPVFAGGVASTDPAGFASAKATSHNDGIGGDVLESQPHNNVHVMTNGFMGDFLSPVDPIFFLHHANLDRLWDVWNRKQQTGGRPVLPEGADLTAWSNEQFLFFSDQNGQPVPRTMAGDYATNSFFEYDYSSGSGEDQVAGPLLVAAAARTIAANVTSRSLAPGATAVAAAPAVALLAANPQAPPAVAQVTLNLSPADKGRRFRVVVSQAGGVNPIEVGTIAPFGLHAGHIGPTTFTVPITRNVLTGVAASAGPAGNASLEIRVLPVDPPGTAAAVAAAAGPVSQAQVTSVQIKLP